MSEKKEYSAGMNRDTIVEDKDNIIVRVSGQGQFKVNREIMDRINDIDNSIVSLLENADTDVDAYSIKVKQKELNDQCTKDLFDRFLSTSPETELPIPFKANQTLN